MIHRTIVTSFRMTSFFFFQAEDGIRDYKVTGVQTCALPIYGASYQREWPYWFLYPNRIFFSPVPFRSMSRCCFGSFDHALSMSMPKYLLTDSDRKSVV